MKKSSIAIISFMQEIKNLLLSVYNPNEVTFLYYAFLKAQSYMLVQSFLKLSANNLCEVHAFMLLLFWTGTCTDVSFDHSAVFIKTTAVMCIVALELPHMLLAESTTFSGPAHLLGFLENAGID